MVMCVTGSPYAEGVDNCAAVSSVAITIAPSREMFIIEMAAVCQECCRRTARAMSVMLVLLVLGFHQFSATTRRGKYLTSKLKFTSERVRLNGRGASDPPPA